MNVNVFQKAKKQFDQFASNGSSQIYAKPRNVKKEALDEGQLVWIGETELQSRDPSVCFKLERGEKIQVSPEEARLLTRTPYERGFNEYLYEGQLRKIRDTPDPTDPRHSSREGEGIMWYPHGSIYEGRWKHNKHHGTGSFSAHTGYKYTGEWVNDVPQGRGYEVFSSKAAIDAVYENGSPNGQGVMLYNPTVNNYRYEGEWKNGHRHGRGVIFYGNGDTFEGTFDKGRRHGRGVTTRTVNGKYIQYETEWVENQMVSGPRLIERVFRTKKPKPSIPYSRNGSLIAADLTKWTIKADTLDLPFEHFMRLKLGFEKLDVVGCGMLPMPSLEAVWSEGNLEMLEKLDVEGKGYITLQDLFSAWYPNITAHNISRFMREHIHPLELLRLRGFLNGIEDSDACGYYHVCGDNSPIRQEGDTHPTLSLRHLEASQYKIGGEKFTAANYATAKQLSDPPRFLEVLDVWYPNIMRMILEHYEASSIDQEALEAIRTDFIKLTRSRNASSGGRSGAVDSTVDEPLPSMHIETFVNAEMKHQQLLAAHYDAGIRITSQPASPRTTSPDIGPVFPHVPLETPIEKSMQPGLFRGLVHWMLGSRIRVTVALLRDIESFGVRQQGYVSLEELLRFCYPNVPCLRTQEALLGASSDIRCGCDICSVWQR